MGIQHKANLQTISPNKAEKLLVFNTYDGQRNAREGRVDEYGAKMLDGRFHIGSVALVHFKGKTYLVDGQKQLMASVKYDTEFRANVQEFTLNGNCTMDDVASIYAQFNVDDSRTRGDIAHAKAAAKGWKDWPKSLVRNLASALDMAADPENNVTVSGIATTSRDEAGDEFTGNEKVCQWISDLIVGFKSTHLNRVSVLAAMILTFRKNQSAATKFWTLVRDGEGLTRGSGPYALREYLKGNSLKGGLKNPQQKAMTGRRPMFAKCVHAWNAYRDDRGTDLKYYANAPVPKVS